jgi:hypothetical protein
VTPGRQGGKGPAMSPSRSQVIRKIKRYWPEMDPDDILRILDRYGEEAWEGDRERVHLAILKVSEGEFERLEGLIRAAKADFRDVIAWAEYPKELKTGFVGMKALTPEEARAVREEDRGQYKKWLEEL